MDIERPIYLQVLQLFRCVSETHSELIIWEISTQKF